MMTDKRLIDTSTLSDVMKGRNPHVQQHALEYLEAHTGFTFSIMTRYEILRGLHAKQASRQIDIFEKQCEGCEILPLTDPIVVKAAEMYALLRRLGMIISDADILIAATALVHQLSLVTENADHFTRIPDLGVESWRN